MYSCWSACPLALQLRYAEETPTLSACRIRLDSHFCAEIVCFDVSNCICASRKPRSRSYASGVQFELSHTVASRQRYADGCETCLPSRKCIIYTYVRCISRSCLPPIRLYRCCGIGSNKAAAIGCRLERRLLKGILWIIFGIRHGRPTMR